MTEQIAEKLVASISTLVPTFYSEAETESYPYCVFDQEVSPASDKDGVYKLTSDCTVSVVSDSFDEADSLTTSVKAAIVSAMNDSQFRTTEVSTEKTCEDGIWMISVEYTIKQTK